MHYRMPKLLPVFDRGAETGLMEGKINKHALFS